MQCPKCPGELREIDSSEGITLDFCGACRGLWFDAGEVADYFELAKDVPDLDQASATAKPTDFVCPKCKHTLVELRYSGLHQLVVDRCAKCGGIWLDQGEVPTLERLSASLEKPASRILRVVRGLSGKGYVVL